MITEVIKWTNGMVMVFDDAGEQMSDYQGQYQKVRERILRNAPPSTVFRHADWNTQANRQVARDEW